MELRGIQKRNYPDHRWTFNQGSEKTYEPCNCPDGIERQAFVYETKYRQLDPQLGRWRTVDPKADTDYLVSQSPYSSMDNNPILKNDPNGDCPLCVPLVMLAVRQGIKYFAKQALKRAATNVVAQGVFLGGVAIYKGESARTAAGRADRADIISAAFIPGWAGIITGAFIDETLDGGLQTPFHSGKQNKDLRQVATDFVINGTFKVAGDKVSALAKNSAKKSAAINGEISDLMARGNKMYPARWFKNGSDIKGTQTLRRKVEALKKVLPDATRHAYRTRRVGSFVNTAAPVAAENTAGHIKNGLHVKAPRTKRRARKRLSTQRQWYLPNFMKVK